MDIQAYKNRFFIEEIDYTNFKVAGSILEDQVIEVYTDCLQWMEDNSNMLDYIPSTFLENLSDENSLAVAKWKSFCRAEINEKYIESQITLSTLFATKGISFETFHSYMMFYYEKMEQLLVDSGLTDYEVFRSFRKLLRVAEAVIVDVYHEVQQKEILEQNELLKKLSTPISELWEGILFLPVIGYLTQERIQQIMQTTLDAIGQKQTLVLVLDISGLDSINSSQADSLIKISKATSLMGCHTIISGISPTIAEVIVSIGANLSELHTKSNLKSALQEAIVYLKEKAQR